MANRPSPAPAPPCDRVRVTTNSDRPKRDPAQYWRVKSDTLNFRERELRAEYRKVSEVYARHLERLKREADRLVRDRRKLATDVERAIAARAFWRRRTAERRAHHNSVHYPSGNNPDRVNE